MVGRIDGIINKFAPELKDALKQEAKKAANFAANKASQITSITRTHVTYTADALVQVAKSELTSVFAGLKGNSNFSDKETNAINRLAEGLVREILS